MKEIIKTKKADIYICKNLKRAKSIEDRMIGLMFREDIHEGYDGLMITPCKSIHTFFMKFPIDVVFLDESLKIVKIIKNMKPWRISGFYFKAEQVLELRGNSISDNINIGDELEALCIS